MTLDPADYWQLRAVSADVERDQAALVVIQARLQTSLQRRQAIWEALGAKYGFDPAKGFQARDEDCSLNEA